MATYGQTTANSKVSSVYNTTSRAYRDLVAKAQAKLLGVEKLYAPGGELETAQNTLIDSDAKKALAAANANAVSTGMSSGSLALGTKKRAANDATLAKAQALQGRYGLYGGAMTNTANSFTNAGQGEIAMGNPYLGATASIYGGGYNAETAGLGAAASVLNQQIAVKSQNKANQAMLDQMAWQNFVNSNPYKPNTSGSLWS
jgi:hypothetical protein